MKRRVIHIISALISLDFKEQKKKKNGTKTENKIRNDPETAMCNENKQTNYSTRTYFRSGLKKISHNLLDTNTLQK